MGTMITESAKAQANQLGNTGDAIGNILMTLIGAVDALEDRIDNIKQCSCEEPKKVSKTTKRSK
mgnify:CR=1 FL=1|jgi:hypothetical protein|tara:strand:- start:808 stop:999 length:192 start_codon:yes stop_codon:yes gene_type:complete